MARPKSKFKLTWKPDKKDDRDFVFHESMKPSQLPPLIDLTNRADWMPPYNQDTLGSCTANAIAGALEYEMVKQGKKPVMPSRLFIYYMERLREKTLEIDNGAEIRTGMKVLSKDGACTEKSWPYLIERFTHKPKPYCIKSALKRRTSGYQRVPITFDKIKMALAEDYPIIGGFYVYPSYFNKSTEKTGEVPIPTSKMKCIGGHAILIVGYDDVQRRLKFRNSYGEEWGDGGYGYLPYSYVVRGDVDDFWILKGDD